MKLRRIGVMFTALVLSVTGSAVATASPHTPAAPAWWPHTALTLVVVVPDAPVVEVARLACDPPRGTHPSALPACMELHRVHGDFDALTNRPTPISCTMEYRPVIAEARGMWRGKPVYWNREFGNDCTLRAATGPVFGFW